MCHIVWFAVVISYFLCALLSNARGQDTANQIDLTMSTRHTRPFDLTLRCIPSLVRLSPLAQEVLRRIRLPENLLNSPVPESALLTYCNKLGSVMIDGPGIYEGVKAALSEAKHEVDLAFFDWETKSHAVKLMGQGLKLAESNISGRDKLLVRILVGDDETVFTARMIDSLKESVVEWGTDENKIQFQLATFPFGLNRNTLHDKFVVVDAKILIVTGANPQTHNDPPNPWHDTGYRIDGDAARSALLHFDDMWNTTARHWDSEFPQPTRSWLSIHYLPPGYTSVIAVGRKEGSPIEEEHNPQNIAWITAFDMADETVHVETPNINAEGFENAVVGAAGRGVNVKLITTLGFNYTTMNLPVSGARGDNQKIVGNLRNRMRKVYPDKSQNLEICWFGRQSGPNPVVGKEEGPSHTKYMSVDGKVAIIGSGNMDFGSWGRAHEFNVLIDDSNAVKKMEKAVFQPDWNNSMCSYIELYEGNHGTKAFDCPINLADDRTFILEDYKPHFRERLNPFQPSFLASGLCNNDEARSLVIYNSEEGRVIRLFDDHQGSREEDWLELIVKRQINEKLIPTFETGFEDADVRAIYHRNNGLDGKVSRVTISSSPSGPTVDFYEGNSGTQNLLCSLAANQNHVVNFETHTQCDNDEASSLKLYDVPAGKVFFLFDHPSGNREDDWVEIIVKRQISEKTIGTFEHSFEDADVRAIYHRNNGLDGKVSRVTISSSPSGPTVDFYEGNSGTQNLLCSLAANQNHVVNFETHTQCDNDEASSLKLYDVPAGKVFFLFDHPSGNREDDWVMIKTKSRVLAKIISTFESSFEDSTVSVSYFRNNGLDGKVSRLEVSEASAIRGILSFYEGNNGEQNKVCELEVQDRTVKFKNHGSCNNDEAKSLVLTFVEGGTIIDVYDDANCSTNDDWTQIRVKRDLARRTVGSFEQSMNDADLHVEHRHDNGLDGKVSCVRIHSP